MMNAFRDETMNQTLSLFLKDIRHILKDKLVCVYIYGSALHHDLCPGYGDLDYLAIVSDNLTSREIETLNRQRRIYRSKKEGYTSMLEGAFLPVSCIRGEAGQALWWGTRDEKVWTTNQLDLFTMYTIRKEGLLVYGESQNLILPEIAKEEIKRFLVDFSFSMRQYGKSGSLYSIDWLLLTAKFIGWLKEGVIFSKSQAADWGLEHLNGDWKEHLRKAKALRKDPSKIKLAEYSEWIDHLDLPIIQAADELEKHLVESANI